MTLAVPVLAAMAEPWGTASKDLVFDRKHEVAEWIGAGGFKVRDEGVCT